MMTSEFLTIYEAKSMEYLLSVFYLLLFVGFWNFVMGAPEPLPVRWIHHLHNLLRWKVEKFFHLPFQHPYPEVKS